MQWVLSSYSLSSVGPPLLLFAVRMLILNHCDRWQGCLLIFFGRLADLHGRKKAFLLGVFWLCAFSLGCGFANSVIALDILRAFQGLGAAAFVPASASAFMSLSQTFDLNIGLHFRLASSLTLFPSHGHAQSPSPHSPPAHQLAALLDCCLAEYSRSGHRTPFSTFYGVTVAHFPKHRATWRALYFLTAGLAVPVFIGGVLAIDEDLPSTEPEEQKRVDWLGAALVTSSLVLIQFVLGQGELAPKGWKTPCKFHFII